MMNNDEPYPLSQLKDRVSITTYEWLQGVEDELKTEQKEEKRGAQQDDDHDELTNHENDNHDDDDEEDYYGHDIFQKSWNDDDDDNKDNGNEEEEEEMCRVHEWSSSFTNPDGIGGVFQFSSNENEEEDDNNDDDDENSEHIVKVKYILSESAGGHGDDIWAASRHIANIFANPKKCLDLLKPLIQNDDNNSHNDTTNDDHDHHNNNNNNPLSGRTFIELGAGAGVPSWTAIYCGASHIVCTDQSIPNRIRCIAECAERNWQQMLNMKTTSSSSSLEEENEAQQQVVQACPYDWGSSIDEVVKALSDKEEKRFDIVLAADCIYIPELHSQLLDSIHMLMSQDGIALLPFALHGNTPDENVWQIIDLAKTKDFNVEVLESEQLTPQAIGMESKRALVHTLRLTRKKKKKRTFSD